MISEGHRLLIADQIVTAVLGLVLLAGVIAPEGVGTVAVAWSLLVFAAGCGAFLWAYGIAVQRSRSDEIGIGGLFFLAGSAPLDVRRWFLGLFGAQVGLSVAAAASRPFTSLAFGVLAPMFGLGVQGLWAARHGQFDPRQDRG